jgi:predicted transglutaminase-like cysteine proteinase
MFPCPCHAAGWRSLLNWAAALLIAWPAQAVPVDLERAQAALKKMRADERHFIAWQDLLKQSAELPVADKLLRVNEFFNRRIQFESDQLAWGSSDYWATPMETLARGKGDCEDFTIAKYFTLLDLKVPNEQLRLVYVKARIGGPSSNIEQAHMVLAYYPSADAEPVVLDNLITDIRPASRRPDLLPIFSFNRQAVYAGVAAQPGVTGKTGQLSRWSDLLRRASAEGFN